MAASEGEDSSGLGVLDLVAVAGYFGVILAVAVAVRGFGWGRFLKCLVPG
jgi:hypothetical protein